MVNAIKEIIAIGVKSNLKRESGIDEIIAPKRVVKLFRKRTQKHIVKRAIDRQKPSPKAIIAPYEQRIYIVEAETTSLFDSLYLSPFIIQTLAPETNIRDKIITPQATIIVKGKGLSPSTAYGDSARLKIKTISKDGVFLCLL